MSGYDERVPFRCSTALLDAFDETVEAVDDDLSRSDVLRDLVDSFVTDHEDMLDDETVRRARRDRVRRRSDEVVENITFRKRSRNLIKSLVGSGTVVEEIEALVEAKQREASLLPDRLNPDEVVEYLDALLVLVYLYQCVDGARDSDGVPVEFAIAVDAVDNSYPERHGEKARQIFESGLDGVEEDDVNLDLDRLRDTLSNGVLDSVEEDDLVIQPGSSRVGVSVEVDERDRDERDEDDDMPNPHVETTSGHLRKLSDAVDAGMVESVDDIERVLGNANEDDVRRVL